MAHEIERLQTALTASRERERKMVEALTRIAAPDAVDLSFRVVRDDEKMLAPDAPIASLSFGAERKFCFKHKQTGQTISLILEAGSLLVMKGPTQKHWVHRLPPTVRVTTPRINLTFRTIIQVLR
jgi:hypothetical protein